MFGGESQTWMGGYKTHARAIMTAGLGTKPLPVQRTLELQELLSMIRRRQVGDERKEQKNGPEAAREEEKGKQGGRPGGSK